MTGRLVISLDFELMWGVRDHYTAAEYGDAVMGGRAAIPKILERFHSRGVHATWATVGFLFAHTRDEILDHAPQLRGDYTEARLSPYEFIQRELGCDEVQEPLYFGASLLDRIADTEGQEIATHSFSHFCCLDGGHTLEAFAADLDSARSIAEAHCYSPESIVFARNQMTKDHISIAADRGFPTYRGTPQGFAYRPRSSTDNTILVRACRLADSVVPLLGRTDYPLPSNAQGITNVAASRFLRPFTPKAATISKLQLSRILAEMTSAACRGRVYHLWFHPHNFGRYTEENLRRLDTILDHFIQLRDCHGMMTCNMREIASAATVSR